MGSGSVLLVRKCAAQNDSAKKIAFIFLNYIMQMKLQRKKKLSGKTGPVGDTQLKTDETFLGIPSIFI